MSDGVKAGPALTETVEEVQGSFRTDAALQDAMGALTLAGFDRAAFSLPTDREGAVTTPNEGADNPVDQIDKSQLRTMGTSMAAYAGAAVAAGATLATGGAAGVALAAAAAVGAGSGLAANAAGRTVDKASTDDRNERGAEGTLILAVRTTTPDQVQKAGSILQQAGATSVRSVARGADVMTAGVSAASWTGG